jgi:hypothetical protein
MTLQEALERFDREETYLAYWQKGTGHRERLREDLKKLHGYDYMANTDARITAIVHEALRDFIDQADLRR